MAITITAGTAVFGTANLTPAIPAGAVAGDLMICMYGTKPYNDAPTINEGWTDYGSPATNGTTAAGVDVGSMQARFFWKRHTGTESNPTITNSTNNVSGAVIYLVKSTSGYALLDPVGGGGGDSSSDTDWSITSASAFGIASGDKLLVFNVLPTDNAPGGNTDVFSASGATFSWDGNLSDHYTSFGGDMYLWTENFSCTSGSSSSAPTYSLTMNGPVTGSGYIVRLRENLPISYPAYRPNRRAQHLLRR